MSKKLQPLYLDLDKITVIKNVFGKLFKNRMSGFVILTDRNFIATNAELSQFEGNALSSSNSLHLVDVLNKEFYEHLSCLLILNDDDLYTLIDRDKLFKFLGLMEKFIKFLDKETSFSDEEKKELCCFIPVRYRNGELVFELSNPAISLLDQIEKRWSSAKALHAQKIINDYMTLEEGALDKFKRTFSFDDNKLKLLATANNFVINGRKITNPVHVDPIDKVNDIESILIGLVEGVKKYEVIDFFLAYKGHQGRRASKYEIGNCFGPKVLASMLFLYFDHIKALHPDGTSDQITEPITRTVSEMTTSNLYKLNIPKKINAFFENRGEYSIVIPVIPGINHPLPKNNLEYSLNTLLWKEDQSIRHLYVFSNPEFNITSFMPHSTLYLIEKEKEQNNGK